MLTVARLELWKLLRQRKCWLALLAMNAAGLLAVLVSFLPPVADMVRESAVAARLSGELSADMPRRFLNTLVMAQAAASSLVGTFFMALVAGSMVAAELGTGAFQILLLAPLSRRQVFAGKVLAGWAFYLLASVMGLALVTLAALRLAYLDPAFRTGVDPLRTLEALSAYALVDLSTVAFFFLVSTLASSESGAMVLALGSLLAWNALDLVLWVLSALEAVPGWVVDASRFTWTRCRSLVDWGALRAHLDGTTPGIPISGELVVGALAWTVLFLVLAGFALARREDAASVD